MTHRSFLFAWLLLEALACGGCRRSTENRCDGISCSGHGKCVVLRREPTCACEEGWRPEGPNCVPLDVPPAMPVAAPDADGWIRSPTPAPPAPPAPPADASPTPGSGETPSEADLDRLCSRALEALARPDPAMPPDLATEAKHDAVDRWGEQLRERCTGWVQELRASRDAVACASLALEQAAARGTGLAALGEQDPAVAACGETWKGIVEARAPAFQRMLQEQRDAFGVAVFGFHRQFGFPGGLGEEFCRRFVAALPDAPPAVLRGSVELPVEWSVKLESCGQAIDGFELPPLLRWCVVDRAEAILAAGSAEPCLPYAIPDERDGVRQLVAALVALAPARPVENAAAPDAATAPQP